MLTLHASSSELEISITPDFGPFDLGWTLFGVHFINRVAGDVQA